MMIDELKNLIEQKVFRPMRFKLRSGEQVEILRAGQIAFGLTSGKYVSASGKLMDFSLDDIVSLEVLPRNAEKQR
jgi:hypothetical protein